MRRWFDGKIEAASHGGIDGFVAHTVLHRILLGAVKRAGASRWISRTTLDGMTRRSERYFDRNEWLCGPHTAIQFQTVFLSSTRPPPADRIRIFLFRENFRRKSGAACV